MKNFEFAFPLSEGKFYQLFTCDCKYVFQIRQVSQDEDNFE